MTFAFVRVRAAELIRGVPVRRRQLERSSGHTTILDSQAPDDPLLESLQDILGHLSTGTTKKETPAGDMPRTDKRPGKSTAVREVESPPTVLAVPMENVNMGGVNLLNSRLDKSSDYNSCTKTGKLPERPQMRLMTVSGEGAGNDAKQNTEARDVTRGSTTNGNQTDVVMQRTRTEELQTTGKQPRIFFFWADVQVHSFPLITRLVFLSVKYTLRGRWSLREPPSHRFLVFAKF